MADMQTESEEKCRVCKDCLKAFNTEVDFEVHLCFQTRKCPFLCSFENGRCRNFHCCLCGKKFNCRSTLEYHKNTHTGEKPHVCPYCEFRSTTSSYLSVHIVRKHSKTFKHNCSFCSKGYVHKSELQRHIQITHPSEETDESIVVEKETDESIVVKKEKGEAGKNQNQPDQMLHCCTHCTYVTKIKNNLVRHLWTHSGNRPYQCEICNKGYTQKGQLKDHLRTHTGERPFVCNTCGRGFTAKTILRTHERLHPEEKMYLRDPSKSKIKESTNSPVKVPRKVKSFRTKRSAFQCEFCPRTFHTEGRLLVHIRVHTDDRPFVCDTCKKGYTTQKALNSHKCVHSEERKDVMRRCPVCPFSASREFSLRVHLQIHSLKGCQPNTALASNMCKLCNRVVNNMEKHLETCKRRNLLQCKFCCSRFTKKELIQHHAVCKEKHPYTCSTCGRGFYTLSYLKFHESMHSTSQSKKTPPVKKELQNPTHLLITNSTQKQTMILPKPTTSQPAPIQNQLIILQPAIILNGS